MTEQQEGTAVIIMDAAEKLQAFLARLPQWKSRLKMHNYANLSKLEDVFLPPGVKIDKSRSLQTLGNTAKLF